MNSLVCVFFSLFCICASKKILLLPVNHNSHANFFSQSGSSLKANGHDIVAVAHPRFKSMWDKKGIRSFQYTSQIKTTVEDMIQGNNVMESGTTFPISPLILMEFMMDYGEELLSNKDLDAMMKKEKFDLAIIDRFNFAAYVLVYKYSVPYITINAVDQAWSLGVPSLPSVEPNQALSYGQNMDFGQRVVNFMVTIAMNVLAPPPWPLVKDRNLVAKYAPEKPLVSLNELFVRSELWFVNIDTAMLGYPRVYAPYMIYVAGLGAGPPLPIEEPGMKEFVDDAPNGVIIFSLGSLFRQIPDKILFKLLNVFKQLPQRVIMASKRELPKDKTSSNVMASRWIPQNDLMGHKNTVLFITHAGFNSHLEGLYHGVPMLSLPIVGDQYQNAERAEHRGYSRTLAIATATEEELVTMIKEVIANPKYKEKISKASRIFHGLPKARDTFVFWTEHILEFGGKHLKTPALEMSLFKVFSVDVILFLHLLFFVLMYFFYRFFAFTCSRCFRSKKKLE